MNKIVGLLSLLLSFNTLAVNISLDGLDATEFDLVTKDFMMNFVHTSVTPPVSLGKVWGVELGVVAGITNAESIKGLSGSTQDILLPHAGFLLSVSVPGGFTGELTILPGIDQSSVKLDSTTFGLRYDLGQHFFKSDILKLAARAHFASNSLGYSQIINNASTSNQPVNTSISVDTSSFGAQLLVGSDLFIIQPYLGFGFVSGTASLNVAGSATIFAQSVTTGSSAETSASSTHFIAGIQIDLFVIHLGVEHQSLFGGSKTSGKLSLAF